MAVEIVKIQIQGRGTQTAGFCDSLDSDRGKSVLRIAVEAFFHYLDLRCPADLLIDGSQSDSPLSHAEKMNGH